MTSSREYSNTLYDNSLLLGPSEMSSPAFSKQHLSVRIGSSTFRFQTKFVTAVALVGLGTLLLIYVTVPSSRTTNHHLHSSGGNLLHLLKVDSNKYDDSDVGSNSIPTTSKKYDSTYPLSAPLVNQKTGTTKYRIAIVTDLDTDSKMESKPNTWISYLKKGYLEIDKSNSRVEVTWDSDSITLSTKMSYDGRGMELSELIVFSGKLYSVDDRTGIVYRIDLEKNVAVPWIVLNDGDGNNPKGFKCEWATVKDDLLYIGGFGKEWTSSTGVLINNNPQWIKIINADGHVVSENWTDHYVKLRSQVGISFPGYMIHESACWASTRKEWVFLPRKASKDRYDDKQDEHNGVDLMLTASSDFSDITTTHVGAKVDTHGFSSFKFIPNTDEKIIVALKSEELEGKTATFITVFDIKGKVLMSETKIDDLKFEGIEFI